MVPVFVASGATSPHFAATGTESAGGRGSRKLGQGRDPRLQQKGSKKGDFEDLLVRKVAARYCRTGGQGSGGRLPGCNTVWRS